MAPGVLKVTVLSHAIQCAIIMFSPQALRDMEKYAVGPC